MTKPWTWPASLAIGLALSTVGVDSLFAQADEQDKVGLSAWQENLERYLERVAKERSTRSIGLAEPPNSLVSGRVRTPRQVDRPCSIPPLTATPDSYGAIRQVEPSHVPKIATVDPPAPPCENWN